MHRNAMYELPNGFFKGMRRIMKVEVDTNLMCCHLTKEDAQCTSLYDDSFASCESMFRNSTPRKSIWVIGILSLLGSVFVIVWRLVFKEKNVVQIIMLMHLAVGDGLMGGYLVTLGVKDLLWSGDYYLHDFQWRSGLSCQITGAISVLSSEVSVMLLALISADRLKNIVFPYHGRGLTPRKAHALCAIIWVLGIAIAFLPICDIGYFHDAVGRPAYYGRSVVCLPLQLSKRFPAGWEYSIAFFVGFNFLLFIFMMFAYIAIFCKSYISNRRLAKQGTTREVQARRRNAGASREIALAKRVFFIIISDCACWMPIIVIGIQSLVEKDFSPRGDLSAWIAVFVLPINSALNPIIYTLSTPQVQRILKPKLRMIINYVRGFFCCCKNRQEQEDLGEGNNQERLEMVEMIPLGHPDPEQAAGQVAENEQLLPAEAEKDEENDQGATLQVVVVEVHPYKGPREADDCTPRTATVEEKGQKQDFKQRRIAHQATPDEQSSSSFAGTRPTEAGKCVTKSGDGDNNTATDETSSPSKATSKEAAEHDVTSSEGESKITRDKPSGPSEATSKEAVEACSEEAIEHDDKTEEGESKITPDEPSSPSKATSEEAVEHDVMSGEGESEITTDKPSSPSKATIEEAVEHDVMSGEGERKITTNKPSSPSKETSEEAVEHDVKSGEGERKITPDKPSSPSMETSKEAVEHDVKSGERESKITPDKPPSPSKETSEEAVEHDVKSEERESKIATDKPSSPFKATSEEAAGYDTSGSGDSDR